MTTVKEAQLALLTAIKACAEATTAPKAAIESRESLGRAAHEFAQAYLQLSPPR